MQKFYNSLVQSFNTVFFVLLLAGGLYFFTTGDYLWAIGLTLSGAWGTWFCGKQVRYIMNTDAKDLPKTQLDKKLAEKTAKALAAKK